MPSNERFIDESPDSTGSSRASSLTRGEEAELRGFVLAKGRGHADADETVRLANEYLAEMQRPNPPETPSE